MTLELRRSEKSRPNFIEGGNRPASYLPDYIPRKGSEEDLAAPSATQLSPISVALSWGSFVPQGTFDKVWRQFGC